VALPVPHQREPLKGRPPEGGASSECRALAGCRKTQPVSLDSHCLGCRAGRPVRVCQDGYIASRVVLVDLGIGRFNCRVVRAVTGPGELLLRGGMSACGKYAKEEAHRNMP